MSDRTAERSPISLLRRVVVGVIIVSFGLAALGGIVVLLGAQLGETAGRVLGTTAVVGAFSVAVLCCASLLGRRLRAFGAVGALVSAAAALLIIVLIWTHPFGDAWDAVWKWMWTLIAASAAFSLASLLLLLADRRRAAVRWGLWITLALFAIVLGIIVTVIWLGWPQDGELLARLLGIVSILAALGAVVVPVLSLLLPDTPRGRDGAAAPAGISADLAQLLVAEARRRGVSVEELVAPVLAQTRRDDAIGNTIEG